MYTGLLTDIFFLLGKRDYKMDKDLDLNKAPIPQHDFLKCVPSQEHGNNTDRSMYLNAIEEAIMLRIYFDEKKFGCI